MYAAGQEPAPERSVDHPSSVKEPLFSSCALTFWSSAALLADGVPLADKHKKSCQIDIFVSVTCIFLVKALRSPILRRFNSVCLTRSFHNYLKAEYIIPMVIPDRLVAGILLNMF